ncbi:MAG: DUF3617 family protein [Sphingomonadaceae bacterium]|nr:DUF3617 family protein [Sphingomonadaceae bacterium]
MAAVAATPNPAFKSGSWEVVRKLTGGPRKQAPMTDTYCITEAQLKADPAAPLKTKPKPRDGQKGPQCTMGAANMADGKTSLTSTCKGPMGSMKANMSGTYTATSFSMSGKMKMGFMSASMSATGRHMGPC